MNEKKQQHGEERQGSSPVGSQTHGSSSQRPGDPGKSGPEPASERGGRKDSKDSGKKKSGNEWSPSDDHHKSDTKSAADKVQHHTEKAGEEVGKAVKEVREQGRSLIEEQKQRAVQELEGISDAIWQAADTLHEHDDHTLAEYVESFGERVDRVCGYIEEHDVQDMISEVGRFARRRPEVFIGALFCAGLAVGRFFKSSERQSHSSSSSREFGSDTGGSTLRSTPQTPGSAVGSGAIGASGSGAIGSAGSSASGFSSAPPGAGPEIQP